MVQNSIPMVPLDLTKSPEELVLDLVNNDNGTSITADQVTFGIPKLSNGKHNSKVVATATANSPYRGKVTVNYNRIDIGSIPKDRSKLFHITNEINLSDLVPAIDERYQLKLTPKDYIDAALPLFVDNVPNEEKTVDLVAAETSLVFINKLTLTIERPALLLSRAITKVILSGLDYVLPANTCQILN